MASLNKVTLIGNLGNDPDVKYTQSGQCVVNASLATTERWKDRDGNQQESTEWHRLMFWGKLGEIAGEYLRKGSQVYVEGRIKTEKWQDQSGADRYTTKIDVQELKMLGSRPSGDGAAPRERQQPPQRQQGPARHHDGRPLPQESKPREDFDDDDVPF